MARKLPPDDYWKRRAETVIETGERRGEESVRAMDILYQEALDAIQRDVDAFYGRYADKQGITLQEAHKRLNPAELESFQRENARYYDEAKRLGYSKDYQAYLRELSARAYLSRQQALQASIRHEVEALAAKQNASLGSALGDVYGESYYHTIFDVQQGTGTGASFARVDDKAIRRATSKPWLGENYSDRVWKNKAQLLGQLDRVIGQSFALGRSSKEIGKELARRMNVSQGAAARLVRTEVNHAANQASLDGYREAGVEEYQFLATLDGRTSELCAGLDGKIFRVADEAPGVNCPPMHPNCRSTTIPYFPPDEFDLDAPQRAARGEDGKTYYVPANMKYEDWKKQVDSGIMNKQMSEFVDIALGLWTPCLTDRKTGAVLQTQMHEVESSQELQDLEDWNFDWQKEKRQGRTVVKLTLEGDTTAQGLLSYEIDTVNAAVYLALLEAAPHNIGRMGKFEGVGPHLFAYIGKVALDRGYEYIYFAAKTALMDYYQQRLGAYPTGFGNRMILDGKSLKELVEFYYGKEDR